MDALYVEIDSSIIVHITILYKLYRRFLNCLGVKPTFNSFYVQILDTEISFSYINVMQDLETGNCLTMTV